MRRIIIVIGLIYPMFCFSQSKQGTINVVSEREVAGIKMTYHQGDFLYVDEKGSRIMINEKKSMREKRARKWLFTSAFLQTPKSEIDSNLMFRLEAPFSRQTIKDKDTIYAQYWINRNGELDACRVFGSDMEAVYRVETYLNSLDDWKPARMSTGPVIKLIRGVYTLLPARKEKNIPSVRTMVIELQNLSVRRVVASE